MREIGKSNVSAPLAARQNGAQPNRASRVVDNRKEYSNPFNGDHDSDFERYSSSQSRRDRTHSNVASNLGRQSKATYGSPSHRDSIGMKGLNVQQRKESPSPPPAPASGARPSALRGGSLFKEELSESSSASSSPIGSRSNQTNSGGEIALETLKPQERASPPRRLPEPPAPQTQKQNEKVFDDGLSSEAASEDEFEATIDPAKETERSPLHERPIVSQPNMSTVDLESGGLLRSSPATPRARKGWWGRFFDFFRKIGVKMKSGVAKLRRSP
ncbi:hypothetical protein AX16_010966 [Volvariella volvacea WC 439]|nr:hypothetical protein AX16_010966 [Volvariella volvacea WC 439]